MRAGRSRITMSMAVWLAAIATPAVAQHVASVRPAATGWGLDISSPSEWGTDIVADRAGWQDDGVSRAASPLRRVIPKVNSQRLSQPLDRTPSYTIGTTYGGLTGGTTSGGYVPPYESRYSPDSQSWYSPDTISSDAPQSGGADYAYIAPVTSGGGTVINLSAPPGLGLFSQLWALALLLVGVPALWEGWRRGLLRFPSILWGLIIAGERGLRVMSDNYWEYQDLIARATASGDHAQIARLRFDYAVRIITATPCLAWDQLGQTVRSAGIHLFPGWRW